MTRGKGKHLGKESREVIEEGIRDGDSARRISAKVGASPSTVTREVKANRTVREPARRPGARLAIRCAHFRACDRVGTACGRCGTRVTRCKDCRTHSCIESCPEFEPAMCPTTESWPYVCPPKCAKRAHCGYPKCEYRAEDAQRASASRASDSRSGIDLTDDELAELDSVVTPLVRQGQSFEAIAASHDGLGVCVRTLYNYQEAGALSCASLELPRKAKVKTKKRRRGEPKGRDRVDRAGRTYDDFRALPIEDQANVCQGDSVVGFAHNSMDILSLMPVARKFQLYLLKGHGDTAEVVACLDAIELAMGSREAFRAVFDPLLLDRGVEFDDWAGIERSALEPGGRRCRVYYCDPMESNQKSECERNHEQLRRILPKRRTDMDALSAEDVATCCSHVNSYPLESLGGRCPFDALGEVLPPEALALLGIVRVPASEVVLRPSLMRHAVVQ